MSFTLSTGNIAYPSASASISSNGDTTATVKVAAGCYLGDGWVQSTGVVAKIYFWYNDQWNLVSTQTILGNGTSYTASTYKEVSASKSFTKYTSSQTISWEVDFHQYTDGVDQGFKEAINGSIAISAKTSYTVSYNANGGSGAPSSQTKWHDETLTLSSTKPTRTGYTFLGWSTSSSATSATYSAGGSYTSNSGATLYAVWKENALTVNYLANYADYCTYEGKKVAVDSTISYSQVHTDTFYYDNSYNIGLSDVQSEEYLYLSRTGYTPTGYWIEENSGNKVHEEVEQPITGQELAVALGTSLESGSVTVKVYAEWRENILTVNYHSNYATYALIDGVENTNVSADKDVVVRTYSEFKYATPFEFGLHDYSTEGDATYLARTRYDAVGYWGTAPEVEIGDSTDDVVTTGNGIAISEDKGFATGAELAEALGILEKFKVGDTSIDLYALWVLLCSRITVYQSDGTPIRGMVHIYDDDGMLHYGIVTVYDQDGNARVVI